MFYGIGDYVLKKITFSILQLRWLQITRFVTPSISIWFSGKRRINVSFWSIPDEDKKIKMELIVSQDIYNCDLFIKKKL